MNLFERGEVPGHRQRVGEFLVRRWNSAHSADEQIVAAEIIHYIQSTPPPGERGESDVVRQVLWRWDAVRTSEESHPEARSAQKGREARKEREH
jgi:hypothetical protein